LIATSTDIMKLTATLLMLTLASGWALHAAAATPSLSGANIPAHSSLVDDQENVWTINSGVIKKNNATVGSNYHVNFLLDLDQKFYQRNTSSEWYVWTGSTWSATNDPRVISSSGARIGVAGGILVDSSQNVWALSGEIAYIDGSVAGDNYNTVALLYYDKVIYCENTSGEWYSWNGSAWKSVVGDPTASGAKTPSASGATIGPGSNDLIDSSGTVWTLPATKIAYRNGARAGSNYNTAQLLYFNSVIYCENTSGEWYSWNGSTWVSVSGDPETAPAGPTDPRGPSVAQYVSYNSPVCPASDPGCTPTFVGNASVTFSKATIKGDSIWVAATVSDYGGTHSITVTDSQGNTYVELNQANDKSPGAQSVAQFYAANIKGGADTVTVNWTDDNYKGVLAVDISGVTTASHVGNSVNTQDGGIAAGSNNVKTASISVPSASTSALLVSLTMDTNGGGSDTGGSGSCAIPSGSGFTQVVQLWNWSPTGQSACNLATFETKVITAAGSASGTFTTTHTSDPYVTVATVFH
jgi:hypothetical protein